MTGDVTLAGSYDCQVGSGGGVVVCAGRRTLGRRSGLRVERSDQRHEHRQSERPSRLSLGGLATGNSYILINNDGTDAINGTFSNYPIGGEFMLDDNRLELLYNGGDGNDLQLNVLARASTGAASRRQLEQLDQLVGECHPPERRSPHLHGWRRRNDQHHFRCRGRPGQHRIPGRWIHHQSRFRVRNRQRISVTPNVTFAFIGVPITLLQSQTWTYAGGFSTISLGPNTLTLDAVGSVGLGFPIRLGLAGHHQLERLQRGRLRCPAPVTRTSSAMQLSSSSIYVPGNSSTSSSGVILTGSAGIGGSLFINAGTLAPENDGTPGFFEVGAPPPAALRVGIFGTVLPSDLTINGTYAVDIEGPSSFDQVSATGSVALGGIIAINLTYVASLGDQFTVIDNRGAGLVSGQFSNMPEGSTILVGSNRLKITYSGGDGNDVVLTGVSNPSIVGIAPSNGPVIGGTTVTMTGNDFQPGATVTVAGSTSAGCDGSQSDDSHVHHASGTRGSGHVKVINPDLQEAFSPVPFTYDSPAITNVTPSSGPVGTSVTISGVNFFGGVNSVTFGGIAASFTVNSDSRSPRRYRAVSRRSGVHRGLGAELRQQLVPIHGDVFADHADGDAERTDDVLPGRQRDVDRPVRFSSYLWSPNGETTQSILVTAGAQLQRDGDGRERLHGQLVADDGDRQRGSAGVDHGIGPTQFCAGGSADADSDAGSVCSAGLFVSVVQRRDDLVDQRDDGRQLHGDGDVHQRLLRVVGTDDGDGRSAADGIDQRTDQSPAVAARPRSPPAAPTSPRISGRRATDHAFDQRDGEPGPSATYTVTVTSSAGCSTSASHTITASSPQQIGVDAPPSVTAGGTATATAQGISGRSPGW